MTGEHFEEWFSDKLLSNITPNMPHIILDDVKFRLKAGPKRE